MKSFNRFIGIDWSGARTPVRTRAIAAAQCAQGDAPPRLEPEIRSRTAVADYIQALSSASERTLVGIDCNFGYSQTIGERQFGNTYDYCDLWQAVEDANVDQPNYFAGGYWTHADHAMHFWTEGKMKPGYTMPQRLTEIVCRQCGYGAPESPFKMIGPKQVGKGGLAGMRLVHALKKTCGDRVAVWPYEGLDAADHARVVIVEIYPRQFLHRAGHGPTKIRDAGALNRALSAMGSRKIPGNRPFSDHDADALVSAAGLRFLCGSGKHIGGTLAWPPMLDERTARREGWIFGVGDQITS